MNNDDMKQIKLYKYFADEDGVVAVEFGMVSVLFLTFTFGIVETGRVLWAQNAVQNAMEATSRHVLVNPTLTDEELTTFAKARMAEMYSDSDGLTLAVNRETKSGVSLITVSGSYQYQNIVPFMPASWASMTLGASSTTPLPAQTPEPTPMPTQTPEPTSTPDPTPAPTGSDPTPEPTPEPTPTPTPEPTECNAGGQNCHPVCPIGHSWSQKNNSCQ